MPNIEDVLSFACETAEKAGEILNDHYKNVKINYKGEKTIVTEADLLSEQYIKREIHKKYPNHEILAEESGHNGICPEKRWLIDPLDGTTNYAHGIPMFSVSIAYEEDGCTFCGVVHDPQRNKTYWAILGGEAFCNNEQIKVSSTEKLKNSLLGTGFPQDLSNCDDNNIQNFLNLVHEGEGVRRFGSAALDLCFVACGELDAFWEICLKPWDTAAGALIVMEAGGTVTDFKGMSFSPYLTQCLATNGKIHQEMLENLHETY